MLRVSIKIESTALVRKFKRLEKTLGPKASRSIQDKGLRVGARILVRAIRAEMTAVGVHKRSGTLRRSIGTIIHRPRGEGFRWAQVGVLSTTVGVYKGKAVKPFHYHHLVELGTEPHSLGEGTSKREGVVNPGPSHPGTPARPFLENAYTNVADRVRDAMMETWWSLIKAEMARG